MGKPQHMSVVPNACQVLADVYEAIEDVQGGSCTYKYTDDIGSTLSGHARCHGLKMLLDVNVHMQMCFGCKRMPTRVYGYAPYTHSMYVHDMCHILHTHQVHTSVHAKGVRP